MSDQISTDPAVAAAHKLQEARAAISAVSDNESTPEFRAADALDRAALHEFADTMPTTPAGALAKLKYVIEWPDDLNTLDVNHIRGVIAYLEQMAGCNMTGPVKMEPRDIRSMVFTMEDCITRAEGYTSALGTLIEYVKNPLDPETSGGLRQVMFGVHEDLEHAVVEARRSWGKLHEATKNTARIKTDA